MGVAAYSRGSISIQNQIRAELPDHHQQLLADINAGRTGTVKLFQDTVVRIDNRGTLWLMDRPEGGWSSFGYPFKSLRDIAKIYAIHFVGLSRDEHSTMIPVIAL